MAIKVLPTSEIRDRIASILKEINKTKEAVFITQYGRAKAVLVDVDQYNSLMDLLEDLEDIADFRAAEGEPAKDFEEFMAEFEGKSRVSA